MSIANGFTAFANRTARTAGHPSAFGLAVAAVLIWAVLGPFFDFSDTWQLVINTATTVVTFLMVFLIQNTQNRDGIAVQLKLDELIRATKGAHNAFLNLEEMTEEELESVRAEYLRLAEQARSHLNEGRSKSRRTTEDNTDQAEIGKSPGQGKASTKASTA